MGELLMIFKVMPTGPEVDLGKMKENIKSSLPETAELNKIDEEPIAFGLVALKVSIILDDKKGGGDQVEQILNEVEDVNSVSLEQMGLL